MVNSAVKRDLDILSCGISWQNGVLHVIVRYGVIIVFMFAYLIYYMAYMFFSVVFNEISY